MALDWQAQQARLNARLSAVFGVEAIRFVKKGAAYSSAPIRVVLDENIQFAASQNSNIETQVVVEKTIISFESDSWESPSRSDYIKIGNRRFNLERPVSNDGLAVWEVIEHDG